MTNQIPLPIILACTALLLCACSKGGGGGAVANLLPVAAAGPDQAVNEGANVTLDGTQSSDADGTIVSYSWVQTGGIAITLTGSGSATPSFIAPAVTAARELSFRLTITDNAGAVNTDDVSVTVIPVNERPLAANDAAATAEDQALVIVVLANDSDADDSAETGDAAQIDPATVTVTNAANGVSAVNADGTVSFAPALNFSGAASFRYTVKDLAGALSNAATVRIDVTPVNDAPSISAIDNRAVNEDGATGAIAFTVSDVDTAPGALAVTVSSNNPALTPAAGLALGGSGANRMLSVTPAANQHGVATIIVSVSDGGTVSQGSFVLTVNSVNDAPVASASSASTDEDAPVSGALVASDVDGDALSFSANGAPANGTVSVSGNTFTFTPAANYSGPASFGFKACDPAPLCSTATVSITVGGVNDAPTLSNITDRATAEDTPAGPIAFTIGDADGDTLAVNATSGNATLVPAAGLVLGGSDANRTLTVTPADNASGSATITVSVSDGQATVTDTFVLVVNAVNDAPVANSDSTATAEDSPVSGRASASDVDGDTLTFSADGAAVGGSVVIDAGGAWTFTPAGDFTGSASFGFKACDTAPLCASATVSIVVDSVNDAPALSDLTDRATDEDTSTGAIAFLITDVDDAEESLTVTANSSESGVVPVAGLVLGGSGSDRTLTITPAANASGSTTITVTVSDGTASNSDTFTLSVVAVNDAPVASSASFDGTEDVELTGTLSGSDVENTALTFAAAAAPGSGALSVNSDGSFRYRPNLNFSGSDSFTFTAGDGAANSAPATISLSIAGSAEAALSVNAGPAVSEADAASQTLNFTVKLSRAPDGPVTLRYATQNGTAGAGDYSAVDGTLEFSGAGALEQTVSVPVRDDGFDENDETVRLTVSAASGAGSVQDAPATGAGMILDNDVSNLLRVGAAKMVVTPTNAQIAGQTESYSGGTRKQFFHLGGFGIGPVKLAPSAGGQTPEVQITPLANVEARARCFAKAALDANQTQFDAAACDDHTWVRVLTLQETGGDVVVFVTLDAVGAGNLIQDGMKAAIIAAAGQKGVTIPPDNILFGQTHSHAGADLQGLWGGVPREWINQVLYTAGAAAVSEALVTAAPAHLVMARGEDAGFNNHRRQKVRGTEEADIMLTLLQARPDGEPTRAIGTILQYAAHPTAIGTGDYRRPDGTVIRVPHADYALGAENQLESSFGGTALYYNGPIADASGSGPTPGAHKYEQIKGRGRLLAQRAEQYLAANTVRIDPVISVRHATATLPITNPAFLALGAAGTFNGYYQFTQVPRDTIPGLSELPAVSQLDEARNQLPQLTPVAITTVSRISLGTASMLPNDASNRLEIVTIPGESTNTFGQYIRRLAKQDPVNVAAPDTHTMLLGLTQNSFGYIIPEEEFGEFEPPVPTEAPYEETVSLGPLTAPLLRSQAYNVLFGAAADKNAGEYLTACLADPYAYECIVSRLRDQLSVHVLLEQIGGGLQAFADACHVFAAGTPFEALCDAADMLAGLVGNPDSSGNDLALAPLAAEAAARGCDILDPSNCLYPFPNDWFTAAAAPGTIQHEDRGGTGRRVNMNPLAMPRNAAGKPVDPTEWNRSDGFSPGALITTFVPNLSLERTFGLPSHQVGLANLALSQSPDAPILVLEVQDYGDEPVRHLVWSEIDQNANILTITGAPNVGTFAVPGATNEHGHVARPQKDGKAALLIRPAKNFAEGKRYIVVLRNLKDGSGNPIAPQAGFKACLDGSSALPPVQARCDQLEDKVLEPLRDAGFTVDASMFLAWDFTIESTESAIGRLRHMRDDAFATLSSDPSDEDCTQLTAANAATCAAPQFTITNVIENPQGGIKRRIEGMLTVPNYLAPIAPSPAENTALVGGTAELCASAPGPFASGCDDLREVQDLGQGAAIPNRLFYSPADGTPAPDANNPFDPTGLRYGDGLPDQNGRMTTRFLCQIPAQATPEKPARASLYGHGQLDRGVAITYEGTPDVAREHNYMFCAVDWFGFRTGDAVNVLSTLVDLSNFAVVPDASQQGMVNFMFLARAMAHPQGLGALPEFQDPASGRPLFDRSEVFYNGNSQGGIFGGVVLAASKDVNRGVLGSLGMNYSTLLTRSKNFDEYAGVLYAAYPDPLDRQVLFSLMQMLWDRSENNGYAHHLVDNTAFGGPTNIAKLDTMYGDPQVTMFSAEAMARTMGLPYEDRQLAAAVARGAPLGPQGTRHPTVEPYYGLEPLDYNNPAHVAGGALYTWDTANNEGAQTDFAHVPPTTNTPPRTGPDRHDASQKRRFGRCHMAHFLRTGGTLIDILPVQYAGAPCLPVPSAAPTSAPGTLPEPGPLAAVVGLYYDVIAAINAVIAPLQQAVADVLSEGAQQAGEVAGISLPPPAADPDPVRHTPASLKAGAAKKAIFVPVGTPLGGYLRPTVGGEYIGDDPMGELTDTIPSQADGCDPGHPESCPPLLPIPDELRKIHSPYATFSPPSRGYYDSLIAKAVALYDGQDYVVLVKTDFIGMLDEVVQDVKADVKARTGIDLGDGLIMSATHTHDGPGALANHSTRYFWLAMDLYQHDVYRKLIGQFGDVVIAALADLRPARIGHGNGLEGPQAGNGINGFRRGRFGYYADNDVAGCEFVSADACPANITDADELRKRIGVLRVDDAATGAPMAVVINFADHGIAFDVENQYFSGDVLGSIEREVEQSYLKPAGAGADHRGPIAMLVQNTGGDVTPKNVEYSIRGIEMLGKRMAPQVRAIADVVGNFQSAPDLRAVSQRIILNRERLGYAEHEYPYPWGAAQCGNDIAVPFADVGVRDIPGYEESGLPYKHPYCIPAMPPDTDDLADNGVAENGAFVPGDTILTAAKIGGITLLVQPGEPLTEYGVRLLAMARAEGYSPADTFVWGYAGDHIGYILPPVKEDWAEFGGAESTTTFWGWKQGQRFINGDRELLRALRDGTAAPADEFQINYAPGKQKYANTPAAPVTPSILPGTAVAQPSNIKRFGTTRFVFEGGDPVLDLPDVTMLHGDGTPVRRPNGEVLNTFFEMHLKYRLVSGRHLWTVEFESPKDWAAGTYRFAVSGKARQGTVLTYQLESDDFAVAPATNLRAQNLQCASGSCSVRLSYVPVPSNYRIIDANVAANQAAPVRTGSVTFSNGTDSVTVAADGSGEFRASIGGTVTVSGADGFGNTTPPTGGPPADGAQGIAGCLLAQDPAVCQEALESLSGLADCPPDESGFGCAYDVVYGAVGVGDAANAISALIAMCDDSPMAPACAAIRSTGGAPDRVVVASESLHRGDLITQPAASVTPSSKTADGALNDWMGAATHIGGTAIYEFGEHIYTDYLFDAFGPDDGGDARRLAVLTMLGQVNSHTDRVDALQQAGGDQLGAPQPIGASADHYGDATDRQDGLDLTEVRWGADDTNLHFLARVAKLETAANMVVLILADTDSSSGMQGLDAGLSTGKFDRAVVLGNSGGQIINLSTGAAVNLATAGDSVAVNTAGYANALEASIPRVILERADGKLHVAVMTARKVDNTYVPSNLAYRFDEPVTIYSERAQALSLFAGNVDGFTATISLGDLTGGKTQTAKPGPGYHERQFSSGNNISVESESENGKLQPYGLFVPSSPAVNVLNQTRLTFWLHYRGGKAHSGAAWTPRLITQLGEEQGNIVVTPRARGTSTWYTTRAHQDLFEVFADIAGTDLLRQYAAENLPANHSFPTSGLFNIDPARVYLSGYSMGGFATYLFGGLYPDLFAAGFSSSGAVTQGAWTGIGPEHAECKRTPQSTPEGNANLCFVEANNGRANAQLNYRLLDNTRYVPLTIHHGTNDELALTPGAVRMGQRLLELQYRYDMTMFLGYEHFTQAIVDEWRDGAQYLNLFARPENPRVVTYKVVPALVKAMNEVQLNGLNGGQPFNFHPDGAYWVDGLVVRDGANGSDPTMFGQIDAQSGRLAGSNYVAVPRTGAYADPANPDATYVSTPVYSPGNHSTPYVRHGLDWQEIGTLPGDANTFSATLTNLSAATLDLSRMGFAGHFNQAIEGAVDSKGGSATLTLTNVGADMTVCVADSPTGTVGAGGKAVIGLASGLNSIRLVPGLGAACTVPPPPDPPDYADLCAAFGIDPAAPLCGSLRETETALRAQCETNGGPERFCTVAGGNLHGLIEECYQQNPGEEQIPACRVVDAFVTGAAAWCRQVSNASGNAQPPELCALLGGVLVSEAALAAYETSWVHRALLLQNQLGYALPLVHNTLIATHNSYNATDDNTPPTLSGMDSNQLYDISGQLRMDVRAIEIDIHWNSARDEVVVCHGSDGHAGCTTEKPLGPVLDELRTWLTAHPEEVVLLYVEDDLNKLPRDNPTVTYPAAAAVFVEKLGDLVYTPAAHGSTCDNNQDATTPGSTSWLKVTRRQMRAAGKQVLMYSEGCGNNPAATWAELFHQKNSNIEQGTQGSYDGHSYQAGNDSCIFKDQRRVKWTRVWEDSTVVTATRGGAPASITPAVAHELMRCGMNMPSLDQLYPADGRLEAMVWSWAEGEPVADPARNCAVQSLSGRFEPADCAEEKPFACVNSSNPDDWVLAGFGPWSDGATACPAGYRFSVPANGYANEKLKDIRYTTQPWLNYTDAATEGLWTGDGVGAAALDGVFQVGTGEANHDPKGRVCFGSGSMCSRSADPSVDGENAFRKNALGGYDHLISKATAITGANGETFILVTTTNIGYFLAYKAEQHGLNGIYDVRLRIAAATGVPSTNITVVSDHSHNGPDTIGIWGGVSAEYMKITADAVVEAAVKAWGSRRDAVIRVAAVNQNDDPVAGVPRLDSSYDLPPGNDLTKGNPYNEFRMLVADDAATDERILTFVNYAPHATVTNGDQFGGKYKLTGDWAAWAPQEAEKEHPGSMGLAAIGTVGSTDWNKSGNIQQREDEARSRLRTLMAVATAQLQPVRGADVQVESTFIREQLMQPALLLNYKPGIDHNRQGLSPVTDASNGRDLRIDRSVLPPFMTGTVAGTYVSAIRIGDVFISTFPGEPFGELDHAIADEGRVQGAREHFLLGGANDFFGYMVKNPETYEQTARTGIFWVGGCPEEDFARQIGLREEGEGACSDHWALMVSPTFGSHIVCTLQDQADRLGFITANRDAECPVFTALDGLGAPPESDSPVTRTALAGRQAAVEQAYALAEQCRDTAAPGALCDALAEGARQAETYAGAGASGDGRSYAGVAVKDASWHLGASAGQFSDTGVGIANDRGFDPYGHSTRKVGSDTLGTRITTRALVVQGANGTRVAIASNDLYLPNDLLHRRTAQLLAEHDGLALATGGVVTGITDQNLTTTSSHSHTSPFYSTPAWGTWIFQDVMDLRFFEYMARQMADAVIEAASTMKPVRMGGATVHANDIQAHTYGPKNVHDGTPAGQPRDYTTQAVTVVSFDDLSTGTPQPLANWVIFGVHPEWVWGEEIVNGDITHAVMRMLDRETGATTVWSQRETGSSGPHKDDRVHAPSARREFQESNFAGYDRAARYLTDSIKGALQRLAADAADPRHPYQFAPYQTGFDVAFASQRFAPPATRPYPGVSNCNSDRVFEGDVGTPITGLPDCDYTLDEETDFITEPFWDALPADPAELARQLNEAGVPIPTSYSASSFSAVQETAAVHLQVFKLGTIAATMSPNEQFTSQALNIESRLDKVTGNIWHGFDWACVAQAREQMAPDTDPLNVRAHCVQQNARYPETGVSIPGDIGDTDFPRARAQIHNDARGWELDPVYMSQTGDTSPATTFGSEAEPDDITKIKGNFTHEEFTGNGYDLVVSVGMANDYWGYMAEYREYRAHSDGYRKALNALGPHGADFVATRLSRMAANLNGASVALPFNPLDAPYQAESVRAEAFARTMGELARGYTTAYDATLPPDGGAPGIVEQPALTVTRFSAATMQFVGGSNYTDMPNVRVERLVSGTPQNGQWQTYGTQEGEVQLQLQFLPSLPLATIPDEFPELGGSAVPMPDPAALALWRAGQFEWVWTASFEAFVSELPNLGGRPGITPAGTYRFVVDGQHRGLMSFPNAAPYHLQSRNFEVVPWNGITVEDLRLESDGRVSFSVGPVHTFTSFKSGAGNGNTTRSPGYTVGPVDYPDSYTGGLSWIRNERQLFAGEQQYCGRCTFRPWADSADLDVTAIPVTVRRADGSTYSLSATQAGGRWLTSVPIAQGERAFIAAGAIVDEYGEKNGADSVMVPREVTPPVDTDGDGVPDESDACPGLAGPAGNNGCPLPPAGTPVTGASLLGHCRAASPDASICDELESLLEPFVAGCAAAGSEFGDDEAQAFCRGVLTADLDALLALCNGVSPEPAMCRPIATLADVLATRNPWLARRPINISHRGGAEEFPENTLFAYAKSLAAGSDMIEADVYETLDGELVVIHDETVNRTTNGTGSVSSFTLAQLKAFDAAYCFRPGGSNCGGAGPFPYRGIATGGSTPPAGFSANDFRIPTLRELLARFPNTLINLELKPDPDSTGSYEGKMAALLAEFGRSDDVMVASFLDNASAVFKAQAPLVSTSVPTVQVAAAKATGQGPAQGVTVGHEAFQVPIEFGGIPVIDQNFIDDAHARGLAVHAWTIDDCNDMVDLLEMGVDGIMTDRPSLLQSVLDARAATADRSRWPCTGTVPAAPPAEAGVSGSGLAGTIGRFLSGLGEALLALLDGDTAGAQAHFLAAVDGLSEEAPAAVSGGDHSLAAALQAFGAALQNFVANSAADPQQAPAQLAAAGDTVVAELADFAGTSRAIVADEAVCAPDNSNWLSYGTFKGSLHEHSGYSDGTAGTEPRDYFAAGDALGLDFMGSSEHSDNSDLPMTVSESCLSPAGVDCPVADNNNRVDAFRKWDATLEQARLVTRDGTNFTAFRGFEWTSDRFGHINVFFSRNDWNAKTTEGYTVSLESFWQWFTTRPELGGGSDGLAVFNHPGREETTENPCTNIPNRQFGPLSSQPLQDACDDSGLDAEVSDPAYAFNDFKYRPEADLRMVGVETFGKSGDAYDLGNGPPVGGWYAYALDKGWHVGPVGSEDEHGREWAKPSRAKTILIARDRSEGALREAMFARRFYSVAQGHNDIRLDFTGNGQPMGSRLALSAGGDVALSGSITAGTGVARLELVTRNGDVIASTDGSPLTHIVTAESNERWYYLRVSKLISPGAFRPIAYSAPIWVQARGAYPVCGEWLAGDLHVHSTYSHDSWSGQPDDEPFSDTPEDFYTLGHSVESQFRIAAARGLDYLAITDHNNVLSQSDPGFGAFGVVPVGSYENSLNGHAQMHGASFVYDAGNRSAAAVNAMAEALRDNGGVFQINHPADGLGDFPDNLGWKYGHDVVPDTIEVWNIGPRYYQKPAPSNTNNDDSTRYWEGFLDRGFKVAATGGSDNHWLSTTAVQGNGQPTTWVFATERSQFGVLDGLRRGRTAIAHQPPLLNGPHLVIEADADGDGLYEAMTGATVPKGTALRVRAIDAGGALLRIMSNSGAVVHGPIPVVTPVFEYRFTLPSSANWVRAEVAEPDGRTQRQLLESTCRNTGQLGDNGFPEDTYTTYCRNQLAVLGMSSALFLRD